ncbi:MAG: hypothetical protein ABI577_07555 [bacterium]
MSLFDPYSHTRIQELRQEQLALKARQRTRLGFDSATDVSRRSSITATVRALTARLTHTRREKSLRQAKPGRPALDS